MEGFKHLNQCHCPAVWLGWEWHLNVFCLNAIIRWQDITWQTQPFVVKNITSRSAQLQCILGSKALDVPFNPLHGCIITRCHTLSKRCAFIWFFIFTDYDCHYGLLLTVFTCRFPHCVTPVSGASQLSLESAQDGDASTQGRFGHHRLMTDPRHS